MKTGQKLTINDSPFLVSVALKIRQLFKMHAGEHAPVPPTNVRPSDGRFATAAYFTLLADYFKICGEHLILHTVTEAHLK